MIGSAAARHLAESGATTILIGAREPDRWDKWTGHFASHWDEGRITRISSLDPTWSELAARSIARYPSIEARSGIDFHRPCGLAWITHDAESAVKEAVRRGGHARIESTRWLRSETGIAAVNPDCPVLYEAAPAGLINPRRIVRAQVELSRAAGATIIDSAAESVVPSATGVTVRGAFGSVEASRVLLATGAYGAELVGVDLELETRLRTVLRAELGEGANLPSLIAEHTGQSDLSGIYWVPPVRYPDGRTMLKIGGDMLDVPIATGRDEIESWFHSGGSAHEAGALEATLHRLLPDATISSRDHQPCVTVYTPDGWPYIGPVDERVVVAVGGSGAAAKSSDELGRLAALAVLADSADDWADPDLDLSLFSPILRGRQGFGDTHDV